MIPLRLGCLDDSRIAVPRIHHGDSGGKIDVAIPLDIPQLGIFRPVHINRRGHADTLNNAFLPALNQILVFHPGHLPL